MCPFQFLVPNITYNVFGGMLNLAQLIILDQAE